MLSLFFCPYVVLCAVCVCVCLRRSLFSRQHRLTRVCLDAFPFFLEEGGFCVNPHLYRTRPRRNWHSPDAEARLHAKTHRAGTQRPPFRKGGTCQRRHPQPRGRSTVTTAHTKRTSRPELPTSLTPHAQGSKTHARQHTHRHSDAGTDAIHLRYSCTAHPPGDQSRRAAR